MQKLIELEDTDGKPVFVVRSWVAGVSKGFSSEGSSSQVHLGPYTLQVKGDPTEVSRKIFDSE